MNAGKSESDYRSHFTKNEKGIVLCPTILNATCTYCKETGHFKGECPVLKAKEKLKTLKIVIPTTPTPIPKKKEEIQRKTISYKQAIIQELFDDDSDNDSDSDIVICDTEVSRIPTPFPALRRKRDIHHDWADDEYWCDSDEE